MKTIGFPISLKENENRRAIIPFQISNITTPELLYFEKGYGDKLGISDEEYIACGCHVCGRQECLTKDIICDPKIGDAEYLATLQNDQIIFGWVHATQNRDITDILIKNHLTAYAWEKMYDRGKHVFWRNNELAGEASVMHAFQCFGKMPYETKAAVIGKGNTARGAMKVLNMLGAQVVQYDRNMEELLREELGQFDVVVNCILWDVTRTDHIIYRKDLQHMKKNSMIIDVSCDRNGGIETCIPTPINNPTYMLDGVLHYTVDHTPALFYKTFSENNSATIWPYLEQLMSDTCGDTLDNALIIQNGIIIDDEINIYQNRAKIDWHKPD